MRPCCFVHNKDKSAYNEKTVLVGANNILNDVKPLKKLHEVIYESLSF